MNIHYHYDNLILSERDEAIKTQTREENQRYKYWEGGGKTICS